MKQAGLGVPHSRFKLGAISGQEKALENFFCSKYARAIQNFWINKIWSKDFLGSKQFLSAKNVDKYHQRWHR